MCCTRRGRHLLLEFYDNEKTKMQMLVSYRYLKAMRNMNEIIPTPKQNTISLR